MDKRKRIFISPLDWGLGHASRLIPVIALAKQQGEVFLGVDERTAAYYKEFFPDIIQIPLKGYRIRYAEKNFYTQLVMQIPRIKLAIFREYFQLKKLVKKYAIDVVISDSRFGLHNRKTRNYIISHQLNIIYPKNLRIFGKALSAVNRFLLNQFTACLIPDTHNHIFAGQLSINPAIRNQHFIGLLSRFSLLNKRPLSVQKFQFVFVLSGPEPQRSILENIFVEQLLNTQYTALIISGQPEKSNSERLSPNILKVSHLQLEEFADVLLNADIVFSRSGYSSVMDYAYLGLKKVVFVPTPKQTEQEYLALKYSQERICYSCEQQNFSLPHCIQKIKDFRGFEEYKSLARETTQATFINL
ncbi:MAG TPA: hypothetical protein DCG69_03600 [Bacteroidales bacterium]|nr:hypothetical protein [Bacteroidales bacterium]